MKRPLGCACLFFILFIRLFYVCFPPVLPDYGELKGREVYIRGRVISIQTEDYNGELQTIYTLDEVYLQENSAAFNSYLSDKNNSVSNTKDNSGTDYVHKKIRCYSSEEYSQIYIGSVVWMKGIFSPYEAADNPGQFDSKFYYHILGMGACLQDVEFVWSDSVQNIRQQFLHNFKDHFLEKTDVLFAPEYGGVIKTILLGDKTDLDKGLKQLYQESGILHILTISGLHISMLGMGCFKLLRKIGASPKVSAVLGLMVVLFYGAMVGTGAATFRAICMFVMQMSAILLGRTYDRLTGLSVAAMLLLLEQPMYVFYSGFLLSFGAVLGVTVISPVVERLCKDRGAWVERLAGLLAGGIGILLATFPMQLSFYYEYPVYSMLINLAVLPLLPYMVGLGAAALAIPLGVRAIATPFVLGCQGILYGYEWICEQARKLPGHCVVLGAPKTWQTVLYYACLILCLLWLTHGRFGKRYMVLPVGFLFSAVLLLYRPVEGLCCRFLSVGQGDCAVFQYEDETYIVDCGSTSRSNVGTQILLPCLKYLGVREVAGVFISHADADHMNGIEQWLENYEHSHVKIGRIILPALEEGVLKEEFAELLKLAESVGVSVSTLGAGDHLNIEELSIQVLHPQKNCRDIEDANSYSQVLLFSYQGQGVLMTGDIGAEQEAVLLNGINAGQEVVLLNGISAGQEEVLEDGIDSEQCLSQNTPGSSVNIAVLKAAHHGSKYSSSETFLQACTPEYIVLSYGVGNSYGHPHREALARMEDVGAELCYTGRDGAITVEIDNRIAVESWRNSD